MKVLVDTCVWSLALRRQTQPDLPQLLELRELIDELRVQMVGPVRQELLTGIRVPTQFKTLRARLRAFPDLPLAAVDYEQAAEFNNLCRSKGVQGSPVDFLICAVAVRHRLAIMTVDQDFYGYRAHLPIHLHEPRIF
jgi:predicted nucleic acid-binding protein